MRLVKSAEMRRMDQEAINRFGIPGLLLMENAGLAVVDQIVNCIFQGQPKGKQVLIIAGPGNNGGDGFVVGRHLFNQGVNVHFLLAADPQKYSGDAAVNLNIIENMGLPCEVLQADHQNSYKNLITDADLLVDALFGTGFTGVSGEPLSSLIRSVNEADTPVLAVDIPSGMGADTGFVAGECIKAIKTVTMGLPKVGLYLDPGAQYTGDVVLGDISFPPGLKSKEDGSYYLIDREIVSSIFPRRLATQHKGDFGHVMVIGGTKGYTGAAVLTGNAALRGGAGLVTAVIPEDLYPIVATKLTEVMTYPAPGNKCGGFSDRCYSSLASFFKKATVLAVGPGLGQAEETASFLKDLLLKMKVPLVLDADALNTLAQKKELLVDPALAEQRKQWVLTPHPGEMARLCGVSISEIQRDRLGYAEQMSREWGVVLVLKGARTIVSVPEGPTFINPTGNPGLATGGTGDVLTGLVASFLAQGMGAESAAYSAVYIHGSAADRVALKNGVVGMLAGDLIDEIPVVIKELIAVDDGWGC